MKQMEILVPMEVLVAMALMLRQVMAATAEHLEPLVLVVR